jgi:predicted dehydrogenase
MGCYCGHLINWLLDSPTHIANLCSEKHPDGADFLTWGWLRGEGYPNTFTFRGSLRERSLKSHVTIETTEGNITIHEIFNPGVPFNGEIVDILRIEASKGEWPNPPYGRTSYDFQFEYFINCLRNKDYTPRVNLESSAFVEEGRVIVYGPKIPQEPKNTLA